MSSGAERYARIHELLARARELDAEELDGLLARECAEDGELRREVLELLQVGRQEGREDLLDERHLERAREALEGVLDGGQDAGVDQAHAPDPLTQEVLEGPREEAFVRELVARLHRREARATRYRREEVLASGGQGVVHRVWDEDLRRHLAMKVARIPGEGPSSARAATDSRSLGRFLEEAQVSGQLEHPGIVPVHELGVDESGAAYFTMQLVQGETLARVFRRVWDEETGWSRARVLGLLLRVCDATAYAHDKGVVHRDLKPSNVMVGPFGEVLVLDWGLARIGARRDTREQRSRLEPSALLRSDRSEALADSDSSWMTQEGDVMGTPQYMSPEQARGEIEGMGPPADVYALGAMLYELLAGHAPYLDPGGPREAHALVYAVQAGPPRSLAALAPRAPVELVAVVERAMRRDPGERYRDMEGLREDLSAFLDGRVVSAYESGAWAQLRKWVRRNRGLAGTSGAACLLLLVAFLSSIVFEREAQANAELASQEQRAAEAARDEVLELSLLQRVEGHVEAADALWPAHPELVPELEVWIDDARELVARLPGIRADRERLRERALPRTEEQRRLEREGHPRIGELRELTGRIEAARRAFAVRYEGADLELPAPPWLETVDSATQLADLGYSMVRASRGSFGSEDLGLAIARRAAELEPDDPHVQRTLAWASWSVGLDFEAASALERARELQAVAQPGASTSTLDKLQALLEELERPEAEQEARAQLDARIAEAEELAREVDQRSDWRFPAGEHEARWWNNQLGKLIAGLELLEEELLKEGPLAASVQRGWSVPLRLALARRLRAAFEAGDEYHRRWEEALPALRATYGDDGLTAQMGLVPLGADPESGLWEFWQVSTGSEPRRGEGGRWEIDEETGVVLVLLPGGRTWMGAQSEDPDGRHYDPDELGNEGPVHEVELSPFLISKYELTQPQWLRMTGDNPSVWKLGDESVVLVPTHPVEQVSWWDCVRQLERHALRLPTEAQWEYACRAGTGSPQPFSYDEFPSYANTIDQASARQYGPSARNASWDDGYPASAPVGSFEPNPFGLHDMIGNVWEWCHDGFDAEAFGRELALDPVVEPEGHSERVSRGACYDTFASFGARASARAQAPPSRISLVFGVRPAREWLR